MSGREWKPGDVAVVWINDRRELALVRPRQEAGIKGALEFAYVNGGFDMVDDLAPGWNARPLLVIDPEDREQVEALLAAMPWSDRTVDRLQTNLRSLITPPKPEEPTGLGAVVEDAEGNRWVKWTRDLDPDIAPWTAADDGGADVTYADITAVKILSEGVQ